MIRLLAELAVSAKDLQEANDTSVALEESIQTFREAAGRREDLLREANGLLQDELDAERIVSDAATDAASGAVHVMC